MKKFAKLLAMVLAVSMVLTMFVGAVDYKDTKDVTKEQAAAIDEVYNWGIMQGYNNEFRPGDPITRDEMAKIMYALKMVGLTPNSLYGSFAGSFADAAELPTWSKDYVGYAAVEGIFVGNDKNEFNALDDVTYIQAAIVLMRALDMETPATATEPAEYTGDDWYTNALKDAMSINLFDGIKVAGTLSDAAPRADIAIMIKNAVAKNAALNAADPVKYPLFALAEDVHGVVIGKGENAKKEATLVIADVDEEILLGELKIEDLLGKRIDAVVDASGVVTHTVADSKPYVDVALGDITFVPDKDNKKDANNNVITALKFGDEVVVENIYTCDFYAFINGADGVKDTDPGALLASKIAADGAYQTATFVISEGVVAAFYAPISFTVIDPKNVEEVYSEDDGWTGKFFVDTNKNGEKDTNELSIDGAYAELEEKGTFVTKTIGNELIVVDTVDEVDGSKLTITKNSEGKIIVKLNGEDAIILDGEVDIDGDGTDDIATEEQVYAWYYENQGTDKIDTLTVYGNLILDAAAAEKAPEVEDFFYAIIKDWSERMADKTDKDGKVIGRVNVVTVTFVTAEGEDTYEFEGSSAILKKNTIYKVSKDKDGNLNLATVKLYGALVEAKDGEDMTIAGITNSVDASKVAFANLTDNAKLADIEIEDEIITVGGKKVKKNTVKAFWIVTTPLTGPTGPTSVEEKACIVVYDATAKFGVFGEILAGQDVE